MLFGVVPENALGDEKDPYTNADSLMFFSAASQLFRNDTSISGLREEAPIPEGTRLMMMITPPTPPSFFGGGEDESKSIPRDAKQHPQKPHTTAPGDIDFSVNIPSLTHKDEFPHKNNAIHIKSGIIYYPAVSFVVPGFVVDFKRIL
jgi:hypothetical protein